MSIYSDMIEHIEEKQHCTIQDVVSLVDKLGGDAELVKKMNDLDNGGSGGSAICTYLLLLIAEDLIK